MLDGLPPEMITLDGINCPVNFPQFFCQPYYGCPPNNQCDTAHHRSAVRAVDRTIQEMNKSVIDPWGGGNIDRKDLGVTVIGYNMCWICTVPNHVGCDHQEPHSMVPGLANRGITTATSRGAVVGGILGITDENVRRWCVIRLMQHELSHNFGTLDWHSKPKPCPRACIMDANAFMTVPGDIRNIWCEDCEADFKSTLHGR